MQEKEKWFETWFDTSYYHILYKNRNDNEAHNFVDNLIEYLEVTEKSTVLDLACGKGRHSIYLNKKNLSVLGLDLSEQSIAYAKQFENDTLKFDVHDMRKIYSNKSFDYVFNLFTSFGYFDDDNENQKAINSMEKMLNKNGILVIDFMNAVKTINNLVRNEKKTIDGIQFVLNRKVENNFIVKNIEFIDNGKKYSFQEKVKALTLEDFKIFFMKANLELIKVFGNFNLEDFNENNSDRLIMILKKGELVI